MNPELTAQARLLSLLRLLLLVLGIGVLVFFAATRGGPAAEVLRQAWWLLLAVGFTAALLAATVNWVRRRWQLALHLVLDLLWVGMLLYYTGGVASPGVVLLFAVVLIANLALPGGAARFLFPALAGLILSGVAGFYLSDNSPFPARWIELNPQVFSPPRIIGDLAVQVGGLFLVDLLGGLLANRLQEQRVFAGGVLDQLGEGVLAIDRQGHIAYVNAEATRLLGMQTSPTAGMPVAGALAAPALQAVCDLLAATRLPALERWRGPGNRQLVLRVTELKGRRGRVIGRTLVIADETRLRTLEDSARRAEGLAALGEMAAGIAHEIRNPLTSLRGCAQELGEVAARGGREDDARLAQVIVTESDRLARIVGDFLQLSRMRPPNRSELEVAPILAEMQVLIANRPERPAGLEVVMAVDDGCSRVYADAGQLRQVLINLINNALEAMRSTSQPRLVLSAALADEDNPLPGQAVRLSVGDNGPGMSEDLRDRVFTPFFSTKPQGTGLGLSLVSRIIREHEGVFRLDSEPGAGTTAVLFLPISSQTRAYKRALGGRG